MDLKEIKGSSHVKFNMQKKIPKTPNIRNNTPESLVNYKLIKGSSHGKLIKGSSHGKFNMPKKIP